MICPTIIDIHRNIKKKLINNDMIISAIAIVLVLLFYRLSKSHFWTEVYIYLRFWFTFKLSSIEQAQYPILYECIMYSNTIED